MDHSFFFIKMIPQEAKLLEMDSLPIEIIAIIFSFLRDWPFELKTLLSVRKTCRLFWQVSMLDAIWKGRFPWGNAELEKKAEELYKRKMFQNRLLMRYLKLMGCYNERLCYESAEEVAIHFAHFLRLDGCTELAFVEQPPIRVQKKKGNIYLHNKHNNLIYSDEDTMEEIISLSLEMITNCWPRTRKHFLEWDNGAYKIPNRVSYVDEHQETVVLRRAKLIKFGLLVES